MELPSALIVLGSSSISCRYPPEATASTTAKARTAPATKASICITPDVPRVVLSTPKVAVMVTE
jgi:hypothetical protein